ncbi:DUF4259 domain-containing protein [Cellulophaga lytica]|uniref:DUF4259 domain-containing protein n=1 Tax=Cellulophaga geojensis KL-A TaxID=1328323 RepID=A0ABN0RMK2_9FLAO|nr:MULTISPECIES: DUF4259 domain-containing protein [Cellulophaga]EWH13092.1 hypothetical protein KLA_11125 [Cellulophaga geojensis KL-A]
MAAWGYGVFDDDTAYDFIDEIITGTKTFLNLDF